MNLSAVLSALATFWQIFRAVVIDRQIHATFGAGGVSILGSVGAAQLHGGGPWWDPYVRLAVVVICGLSGAAASLVATYYTVLKVRVLRQQIRSRNLPP